jgi:hypothetical protein
MNRAYLRRRRLRRHWYRALEGVPVAYCAWQRRFPDRHVVDRRTDLLVEGYPSAANTFTREALQRANPGIRIASHLHSVAHLRRALRLRVPALILLRPPVDSVVSVLARFPDQQLDVASELRAYERFYRGVLARADRVALARFDDTTSRLGDVVRATNRQLGTDLVPFDHDDPEARRVVQATIDSWTEAVFGPESESHRALPSVARRQATGSLRTEVSSPAHAAALARCEALHRDLDAVAVARFAASCHPASQMTSTRWRIAPVR